MGPARGIRKIKAAVLINTARLLLHWSAWLNRCAIRPLNGAHRWRLNS